jgi:hypothetical protein
MELKCVASLPQNNKLSFYFKDSWKTTFWRAKTYNRVKLAERPFTLNWMLNSIRNINLYIYIYNTRLYIVYIYKHQSIREIYIMALNKLRGETLRVKYKYINLRLSILLLSCYTKILNRQRENCVKSNFYDGL